MPKRIAVFQHLDVEHPGIFRDFLRADGITWDAFELDEGAEIPDLNAYDGLWAMGGPMDVWEESEHPWLAEEKRVIRYAVKECDLPFLGICLGHQLLADALGGKVGKAAQAEVGLMDVQLTVAGRTHPAFEALPATLHCLQWHGAEVTELPPGASLLASSERCEIQAFAVGKAIGAQFHVEITDKTIDEWATIPAYAQSLEETLGAAALSEFKRDATRRMQSFNADAERFYTNWKRLAGFA